MSGAQGARIGIAAVIEELQRRKGWQIEGRLGRGGFGEVYRARVGNLHRAVRISLDPIREAKSAQQEHEVIQQLANLQLLSHPRLVNLVDYDVVLGYLVTVWELADDPIRDLAKLLEHYRNQNQPGIPRKILLQHIWGLAEAIDFLNQRGLYHRDIKPENCLLFQGQVKLADFGLTRFASVSQTRFSSGGFGSLGYAPPEALEGKHSPTCDVYALASMYAYLATGRHPFGLETALTVNALAIVERQRRGQWDLKGLTQEEASRVTAALHPDPSKRFAEGARAWVRSLLQSKPAQKPQSIERIESPSSVAPGPGRAMPSAPSIVPVVPQVVEDFVEAGTSPPVTSSHKDCTCPQWHPQFRPAGFPAVMQPTGFSPGPHESAPAAAGGATSWWYVRREAQTFGPFTAEQLRALVQAGRVAQFDMLLDESGQLVGLVNSQAWLNAGSAASAAPAAHHAVETGAAQQVGRVAIETPGTQPGDQPTPQVQPVSAPAGQAVAMPVVDLAAPQLQDNPVPPAVEICEDDQEFIEFVSKRIPAGICGILLGGLGIHKFILGRSNAGLIMLLVSLVGGFCTFGVTSLLMAIIGLVEGIIYLTKNERQFFKEYYVHKKEWF